MTDIPTLSSPSLWRRVTALYARLLEFLLAVGLGVLIIPVTLQIISRYTSLIPSYIWTEEMARFLFVWTIMIGAMVGVREAAHFEVDVWPDLSRRAEAAVRIAARLGILALAVVFVIAGVEFTRFAWNRTSELADLPLWLIHVAWPVAGFTWIVFAGEQILDEAKILFGEGLVTGTVLSAGQAAAVLFGTFAALLIARVPVAFALGLACLPILLIEPRLSMMMLAQETFNAYNSFILLAVPFFLLTANLMSIGGITDRLVALSRSIVGSWPGSLAQINVVLSVFFAGISGSSTADAASQSKIFIDAQTREGYDLSFSIAITAVSAVLAVIIPPSILMIVWGGLISTSIAAMYLAGIVPGLLIAGAQMVTVHVYAVKRGYPTYPRETWHEMACAAWRSLPALMTPFIIVGGILLGWFTATESACVAVLYSIALSTFFYRETGWRELYGALLETGRLAGVALFCVGTASAFGWLLAYYRIPQELLANVSTWGMGPIAAGFFIAFCFLVVGCFLDAIPAIIIVGTVLEPLARSVDLHPVQFAIISIVSLAFGLVTPPYGLCLMIACAVAGVRLRYALKDTMIMLIPMLVVLAALIVWPEVCLFLPRLIVPEMLK